MKKKIDLRTRMREIKFTTENHLTEEQLRKLIQEKYERARTLRDSINPRESKAQKFEF
jgi:protein-arginine kinase activator protein McsA